LYRLPVVVADAYGSHGAWRRAINRAAAEPLDPEVADARPEGLTQIEADEDSL